MAAGFARLTKARGIAATTLDNLTLPLELLRLLELLELLLREFLDIVNSKMSMGLPNVNIVGVHGRKLERRYIL